MNFNRTLLTCFLAVLVFITSTGMTINLHFCADDIQSISLKEERQDCMMAKTPSNNACSKEKSSSLKKATTCCQDQQIKAKESLKNLSQKNKEDNQFVKTIFFLKTYFADLFSFENDSEDEEKPQQSLFPLLKEGLYILLGQFRK